MILSIQPQHPLYILTAVDNVVLRLVHLTRHLERGSLIHIEQGHNADDFLLTGIVGRVEQFHGRPVFPVAFFHPGSQLRIRDSAKAMAGMGKVGLFIRGFASRQKGSRVLASQTSDTL